MLVKDALVVKLPGERVKELLSDGTARPFDPGHGRVMKEWVRSTRVSAADGEPLPSRRASSCDLGYDMVVLLKTRRASVSVRAAWRRSWSAGCSTAPSASTCARPNSSPRPVRVEACCSEGATPMPRSHRRDIGLRAADNTRQSCRRGSDRGRDRATSNRVRCAPFGRRRSPGRARRWRERHAR